MESEMIVSDNGFVDSVISQVIDDMVEQLGYSKKRLFISLIIRTW